ncbi:hypothetical protein XANCAGTX0491_002130 [Xanthoria calcicola]
MPRSTKPKPKHLAPPSPTESVPNRQSIPQPKADSQEQALAERLALLESTTSAANSEVTPRPIADGQITGVQHGRILASLTAEAKEAAQNARDFLRQMATIDNVLLVYTAAVVVAFIRYREYIESVDPRILFRSVAGIWVSCAIILWFKRSNLKSMVMGVLGALGLTPSDGLFST